MPETLPSPFEAKIKARDEGITRLASEAAARGQTVDRAFWAMVYDFEVAPLTTNRRQLRELGFDTPSTRDELAAIAADGRTDEFLRTLCGKLAIFNIYLVHTEHLTDLQLLERLCLTSTDSDGVPNHAILDEEVRDIPPVHGVREYIDLIGTDSTEDADLFERYYAKPATATTEPLPFPRPWLPAPSEGTLP